MLLMRANVNSIKRARALWLTLAVTARVAVDARRAGARCG
jgi:hypothetical protein